MLRGGSSEEKDESAQQQQEDDGDDDSKGTYLEDSPGSGWVSLRHDRSRPDQPIWPN